MTKAAVQSAFFLLVILGIHWCEAGNHHKPWKHKNYTKDNFYHQQRRTDYENQLRKHNRQQGEHDPRTGTIKINDDWPKQPDYRNNKRHNRANWTREPAEVMEDAGLFIDQQQGQKMTTKQKKDGTKSREGSTSHFWASFQRLKQRVLDLREKYNREDHSWDLGEFQTDVWDLCSRASHVGLESLRICGHYAHQYLDWIPIEVFKEILANLILP